MVQWLFSCVVLLAPAAGLSQENDAPDKWVPSEGERRDRARDLWRSRPDPQGLREGSDLLADDLIRALLELARNPQSALDFTPRRYGPPPRLPYEREFERLHREFERPRK